MDLPNAILRCLCGPDEPPHVQSTRNGRYQHQYALIDEKPSINTPPLYHHQEKRKTIVPATTTKEDEVAANIIAILRKATSKNGTTATPVNNDNDKLSLSAQIDEAVGTTGWSEWLAEKTLHALEDTLRNAAAERDGWGEVLADAYDNAMKVATELFADLVDYVKEHPLEIAASVLLTLCAFGVLARLVPVVLRLIGFGELGPIVGKFVDSLLLLCCGKHRLLQTLTSLA